MNRKADTSKTKRNVLVTKAKTKSKKQTIKSKNKFKLN